MFKKAFFIFLLFSVFTIQAKVSVNFPDFVVERIESEIEVQSTNDIKELPVVFNDSTITLHFEHNVAKIPFSLETEKELKLSAGNQTFTKTLKPIPLWLSVFPPLLAIVMALLFKEVISSLLIGLFFGAFTIEYFQSGFIDGLVNAFKKIIDTYIIGALNNWDHLAVIIFSTLIGGMVALISKNGGMKGVVNIISRYANTPKSGQFATWLLGVAIFFDDYANTLVVGHTMRSITDKLKISREKLSYLVDSTAAPVAAIAFVTT